MASGDKIYIADKATLDSVKGTVGTINTNVTSIKSTAGNIKTDTADILEKLGNPAGGGYW